jgi:anti-sigma regulatory factor (Ser/Thr protein kinase)
MAETPNVHLSLPNNAENVLLVRQALSGVAAVLALDAIETNDLNTAVTEACNNVVTHAYDGEDGPLEVDVYALPDALTVVVRDRGSGIRPHEHEHEHAHTGMGIPVIQALARRVEFAEPLDGGTEVRMEFDAPKQPSLVCTSSATESPRTEEPIDGDGRASAAPAHGWLPGTVELRLAPNAIARAVLPRVLSALAARAYFSIDRIADVQVVAAMLAAKARESIVGDRLDVGVTVAPRNLELRVGPPLGAETFELSLADRRADSD